MARRGESGLSLVVGIDKPAGMTSHDVVDTVRRIYGERRVGHMGTLDPDATGALAVCVGPATRLNAFLHDNGKHYRFDIVFGASTTTDDESGDVIAEASVPDDVYDLEFAQNRLRSLVGTHEQIPPAYSAVKVAGVRSHEAAREGRIIDLKPRTIRIFDADVLAVSESDDGSPMWNCVAAVSGGTYVRSIARDVGAALGTRAHVGYLRRLRAGNLSVDDCVTPEALADAPFAYLLDPVKLLGLRVAFARDGVVADVSCGRTLAGDIDLFSYDAASIGNSCSCSSGLSRDTCAPEDGECIAVVADNLLVAVYRFDERRSLFASACGLSVGVCREPRL